MKYFEISTDNELYNMSPQIINWYEAINVRLIGWDTYHLIPERHILTIAPSADTVFTDIVDFPFLLVSATVKKTIQLYGDDIVFKEVVLLDPYNKFIKQYFMPIMQERINDIYFRDQMGVNEWESLINFTRVNQNFFWLKHKEERYTIISLDLAESLLRRNVVGLKLREVFIKKEKINESREN